MINELEYYSGTFRNFIFEFLGELECLPLYHFYCPDGFNVFFKQKFSRKHKYHQKALYHMAVVKQGEIYFLNIMVELQETKKKYELSIAFDSPIDICVKDIYFYDFKKWVSENAIVGNFINEMKKI